MTRSGASGFVHSIQARLKNEARARNRPFAEVLELYAIERLLHRLGRSRHRDHFVLKGALLLRHWLGVDTRPTRDIDLLGPTHVDSGQLRDLLGELIALDVEDDGITFERDSIVVAPIRRDSPVLGLRARFDARLGRSVLRYQVDVGLGDAVFPPTEEVTPGGLLGLPMASVRAYTPYTTIAEKLEAIVVLGEANSRIKDYYDLALLPRTLEFDGEVLVESVRRTFARRSTPIPATTPDGLLDAFAHSPINANRWRAFMEKGRLLESSKPPFEIIVAEVRHFLMPAIEAARAGQPLKARWPPGGPWQ